MKKTWLSRLLCVLCVFVVNPSFAVEPWATYRGNPQRTGNTDGKPGPDKPNILWVLKTKEHHIASPVPAGNRLFVSGLGAFNVAHFSCLSTEIKSSNRILWTKTTPY